MLITSYHPPDQSQNLLWSKASSRQSNRPGHKDPAGTARKAGRSVYPCHPPCLRECSQQRTEFLTRSSQHRGWLMSWGTSGQQRAGRQRSWSRSRGSCCDCQVSLGTVTKPSAQVLVFTESCHPSLSALGIIEKI
jgi:hypothetical protein